MTCFRIALITVPHAEAAKTLATEMVAEHLAACVNIIPNIQSVYRWQGEIHQDTECLLLCKTTASLWEPFCAWVLAQHPYEVPEVIELPITEGSSPYLDWLADSLKK